MKKILYIILSIIILLTSALPASAMGEETFVQLVHISKGDSFDVQTVGFYITLESALAKAVSGDIIEVFGDVTVSAPIVIPQNVSLTFVSGTKRYSSANFGRDVFEYTDPDAVTRTIKKNFSGSLFTLSENSNVTFENIVLDGSGKGGTNGGLIYAESGAQLTLKRGAALKNSVLGSGSYGGAVYAESGSSVTVENTSFSGNNASSGKDIYAEQKSDITIAGGVNADTAYGESVDINGLSLILSGDIGLVFHTDVPDKYTDGSFTLTCRTGKTVSRKISDCMKDEDGEYIIEYNPSAVELSEPITLTVYDSDGKELASKTKSVEDYANLLLAEKNTTQKEKDVIIKLLNFGHYAQLECAASNGLEIGKDFAETKKYADLTVSEKAFDAYAGKVDGKDNSIGSVALQLSLAYKPGINVCLRANSAPKVTVNGRPFDVKLGEGYYNYIIQMDDIGMANLASEYTVCINGKLTLVFSPLTYCWLCSGDNDESLNASKALYELYLATVEYKK